MPYIYHKPVTHVHNLTLDDNVQNLTLSENGEVYHLSLETSEHTYNLALTAPIPGASLYWSKEELQPMTAEDIDTITGYLQNGGD